MRNELTKMLYQTYNLIKREVIQYMRVVVPNVIVHERRPKFRKKF